MKKSIILLIIIFLFSGCVTQQSIVVQPVRFDQGFTDVKILKYSGDLKEMCAKVIYGGSALRYASTAAGRTSGVLAGLLGVAGEAGRGTVGILSMVSGASYESQSIFDAKGKAAICVYGLQRLEEAEVIYAKSLLNIPVENNIEESSEVLKDPETLTVVSRVVQPVNNSLSEGGVELYQTILKTKKVMLEMFMGQVPKKGDL